MTTQDTKQQVTEFLHAHNVLNLGTVDDNGVWTTAVYYAHENENLYFLSSPNSRHAVSLRANPQVSASIQRDRQDWDVIKGVQLAGKAYELSGDESAHAMTVYDAKHKLLGLDAPEALSKAMAHIKWYRLEIEQLLFIDNERGFGHRESIDL